MGNLEKISKEVNIFLIESDKLITKNDKFLKIRDNSTDDFLELLSWLDEFWDYSTKMKKKIWALIKKEVESLNLLLKQNKWPMFCFSKNKDFGSSILFYSEEFPNKIELFFWFVENRETMNKKEFKEFVSFHFSTYIDSFYLKPSSGYSKIISTQVTDLIQLVADTVIKLEKKWISDFISYII